MKKLYLDCDGVILDTINKSYEMLKEMSIFDDNEVQNFYRNLSWDKLIEDSGEIDNAISKIKELTKYFDVSILTHVNSINEEEAKIKYFGNVIPEVMVISVPKTTQKADMVDTTSAILVDDFLPNLEYWEEKGGIPVKFSDSDKECPYTKITDLLELIDIFGEKKVVTK